MKKINIYNLLYEAGIDIFEDEDVISIDRTLEDNGFIKGIIEYELLQHKKIVKEYK